MEDALTVIRDWMVKRGFQPGEYASIEDALDAVAGRARARAMGGKIPYDQLEFEYVSTRGLWCIDHDPAEVDYEWIKRNAFQLESIEDGKPRNQNRPRPFLV